MCTGVTLKSKEGNYYWGRTQEYRDDLPYDGMIIPRNFTNNLALTPYKTKYASIGVSAYHVPMFIDGVNEKGLAGGTFYFATYYRYASEEKIVESGKTPLRPEDLPAYVLSNYATCEEIKNRLNDDVAIANTPNSFGVSLPQHMVFQDEKGDSVVVEPSTEGRFDIYDNPVGIFTNSPKFDWHLINLQNYVGISESVDPAITMGDLEVISPGLGTGFRGIPGDFTPQSRFIRAAYLKNFIDETEDNMTIPAIFHILSNFDIPKGVVKTVNDVEGRRHHTQYTSAYDIKERKLHIHMYDNRVIQTIKLDEKYFDSESYVCFKINVEQQMVEMEEYQPN